MSQSNDHNKRNDEQAEVERLSAILGLIADNEKPVGVKPDLQEILAWHMGKLDSKRAEEVKTYVARDSDCYQLWSDLLAEENLAESEQDRLQSMFGRVRRKFMGSGWQQPFAMAASLMLIVAVSVLMIDSDPDDLFMPGLVRGQAEMSFMAEDPNVFISNLETNLQKQGADVMVVQINENVWSVVIDVSHAKDTSALREMLVSLGIKPGKKKYYRLKVRKK